MSYEISRVQRTSVDTKSIVVIVTQSGQSRAFEAVGVPLAADPATYIAATYTELQMWNAGVVSNEIARHNAQNAAKSHNGQGASTLNANAVKDVVYYLAALAGLVDNDGNIKIP